jgi:hypothetical protein
VLEANCVEGLGLMTYLGKHPHFGDIIWVLPALLRERPADLCSTLDGPGYFQFYPATTAARHRLIQKVGFCTTGMRLIPTQWRNIINEGTDGIVRTWNICDERTRVVREVLTPEERALPIGEIVNHALLCDRLRKGWTPVRYEVPS